MRGRRGFVRMSSLLSVLAGELTYVFAIQGVTIPVEGVWATAISAVGVFMIWLGRTTLDNKTMLTAMPGLVRDVAELKGLVPGIKGDAIDAAEGKVQEVLSSFDQRLMDTNARIDVFYKPFLPGDPDRRHRDGS